MSNRIVVVGGVACGPKAAARARRRNAGVEIIIVERGEYISYAGCGLPYFVGGTVGELEDLWRTQFNLTRDVDYFKSVKDIDVWLHTEATEIDRNCKCIHLRNMETGKETTLDYDRLVLATGACPVRPPIEGLDLDRVFSLHVPGDAARIRQLIEADEVDRAVIIGGGRTGLEAAEAFFAHAVDVTIVEREAQILPGFLDDDMAAHVQRDLCSSDLEVITSEVVTRIENGLKVVTDKRTIEADLVLVAAGVAPNVDLARAAGLTIGTTGAIAVNEYLQTSDADIYAGGDCVESSHRVSGGTVYAPLGSTANKHGRVIGNNLTGEREVFPGIVGTGILKSLGCNIAKTGLMLAEARDAGFDAISSLTPSFDKAHYYPGGKPFLVKLVADSNTEKLLGAQLVGPGDVAKRVDVLATALTWGATLKDLADLDLAYAPPYSTAVDPIAHAANHTRNQLAGMAVAVTADELRERIASNADVLLLDVRQPSEVERGGMSELPLRCVPLPELRRHSLDIATDREIIVICQSGLRGYEACRVLLGMGYTKTSYLQGGVKAWIDQAAL